MNLQARSQSAHKWFAGLFCLIAVLFLSHSLPSYADTTAPSIPKNAVKFDRLEDGQYVIGAMIDGQGPFRLMVDTGASRTSVFESTVKRLNLQTNDKKMLNISGMVSAELRPVANIKTLAFAGMSFKSREIVILEDWPKLENRDIPIDGILGMDMLAGLILRFYHDGDYVKVRSDGIISTRKFRRWTKLKLTQNPYPVEKFGLIFTNTKFGDLKIPTLVDTGAGFTAMNWRIVQNTTLAKTKRRLREDWVVQGAVGEFKPRVRVTLDKLVLGGFMFGKRDLVLVDFNKMPVNNYGAYPLVVCGIDILGGNDFVLDLKNNNLYLKTRYKGARSYGRLRSRDAVDILRRPGL